MCRHIFVVGAPRTEPETGVSFAGPAAAANTLASRTQRGEARFSSLAGIDFTRTRLGAGIPLARADSDLEEIGRQAVEEAAAYHPDRDVRFEASGPLRGSWDGARVSQALSNLVGNAVQHGAADTPVTVTARGGADDVSVAVHNRGPAILPAHLHQIFSPLKRIRLGVPRPQDAGSMGLGLYIANEIVKGHGGRIDVDSSDGRGTTFTVHLPRYPPAS
jgi:signal transduction histidine kinase